MSGGFWLGEWIRMQSSFSSYLRTRLGAESSFASERVIPHILHIVYVLRRIEGSHIRIRSCPKSLASRWSFYSL
jgi:hypothetical protein